MRLSRNVNGRRMVWLLFAALGLVSTLLVAGGQAISHPIAVAVSTSGNGNGNGSGNGNSGGSQGHPFTVTGTVGLLYPGLTRYIDLTFINPNNQTLTIPLSGVSATIASNSPSTCASNNFAFMPAQQVSVTVAPNSTLTLSPNAAIPTSSWPAIKMLDNGNQNGCRGVGLTFSYTAGATG